MDRELAHRGVTDLRITDSMHERKALMASLANGSVALRVVPGLEVAAQRRPGPRLEQRFYTGLRDHVARMISGGFIRPEHTQGLIFGADAGQVLDAMAAWQPPAPKWTTEPPPK